MDKILYSVNDYYTKKIKEHGVSPRGVDWNGVESQELRFELLCKVIDYSNPCSVLDFGCGYGAMSDYLARTNSGVVFTGFDISEEMIKQAMSTHQNNSKWITELPVNEQFDYVIASGIFNVRLDTADEEWKNYIIGVLNQMNGLSRKGFSFNMLTSYSDAEYMRDYLYYAQPAFFFDYCKVNFSKYVALLHDYPLYEFTILVRKN